MQKKLHYHLTTDQGEIEFLFLNKFNETGKGMNIKFTVFPERYELCGKPGRVYKTSFENFSVNYQRGSATPGGEKRTKKII